LNLLGLAPALDDRGVVFVDGDPFRVARVTEFRVLELDAEILMLLLRPR